MNKSFLSQTFVHEILPILDGMEKEVGTIGLRNFRKVSDGYAPTTIAINSPCYAYTLSLRDKIDEAFPDIGITVTNEKPSNNLPWDTVVS